jgi:hypothetical protein
MKPIFLLLCSGKLLFNLAICRKNGEYLTRISFLFFLL